MVISRLEILVHKKSSSWCVYVCQMTIVFTYHWQFFSRAHVYLHLFPGYRISVNSFRGNYSFLNLTLCTLTKGHSTYRCKNYSREETIRGNTVCAHFNNLNLWYSSMKKNGLVPITKKINLPYFLI